VEPAEKKVAEPQQEQDERWMRHAMALVTRAEGEMGESPVGTAPMFKAHRQYKEVRA